MEPLERDATMICAALLREGYLPKHRAPYLEVDEHLQKDVQQRLSQTGLELVWNTYSPYYAVRFTRDVQDTIQQSNNIGLRNNEVAMLVILWSKLILPKRLVVEDLIKNQSEVSGDKTNIAANTPSPAASPVVNIANISSVLAQSTNEQIKAVEDGGASSEQPQKEKQSVKVNELYAEFGSSFGSKTTFRAILSRLNNLQFIKLHDETITEGIFLDLLVDGYQMGNEIKKSALAFKLAGLEEDEEDWDDDEEEDIVETEELKEPAVTAENGDNASDIDEPEQTAGEQN